MPQPATYSSAACPSQDELRAFVSGELPRETIEAIGVHIATCARCSAFVERHSHEDPTAITGLRSVLKATTSAFDELASEPECERLQAEIRRLSHLASVAGREALPAAGLTAAADALHIGRYFLIRELGSGGFATVYLASDPQHDRHVAIKVGRRNRRGRDFLEHFRREAKTAASLNHPNIVRVQDYGELGDGRCFLVMRHIDGKSLDQALKTEHFNHRRAAQIVAGVARGLHYAHQRGLVHRDVKPANILLDQHGTPLVADFGLAISEDWRLDVEAFAGTLPYMSPEQIRAPEQIAGQQRHLDARSDIWSLGVVFYQLLTRQHPFPGKSLDEWREQITQREVRPPRLIDPTIPGELERIVLQCLRKQIPDRYTTAQDVAQAVAHWLHRGRRRMIQVAAVGLACLALSVIPLLTSDTKRFSGPPLVEAVAKVNEPVHLLRYAPRTIRVPVGRQPAPVHSAQHEELTVTCVDPAFIELGSTNARNFHIQADLLNSAASGDAGFFFGLDRKLLASGAPCNCATIMVRYIGRDDVRIECAVFTLQQTDDGIETPVYQIFAERHVEHPGPRGAVLEVDVRNGLPQHIRWNGTPLPRDYFEQIPADANFTMSFGVVNRLGATTFRDAKCIVLP